jgi:valyl-tRNA synthetase
MKFFFFQGLIDLDAEIAKSEKKLQLARLNLDKVTKVEAQSDYVETVPENVRSINEDRVRCYHDICSCPINLFINPLLLTLQRKTLEAEISTLEASKEMFARLK